MGFFKSRLATQPHRLLLWIGFLVGGLLCVFIPFGAGFDETAHLIRVFDISGLHLVPNQSHSDGTVAFNEFFTLSWATRNVQTPASDLLKAPLFFQKPDHSSLTVVKTASGYFPVMFFPQAVVVGLFWRILDAPILPVVIIARLVGLLVYLLLGMWSMRLIPFARWPLLILLLSPMALFQAATINGDGFTNAVSFLFISLVLSLYADRSQLISPIKTATLVGVIVLLGCAKPASIVLIPLAFVLTPRRFFARKGYVLVWAAILLSIVINLGWVFVSPPGERFVEEGSMGLMQQLIRIMGDPLPFLSTLIKDFQVAFIDYLRDWVGVYGGWAGIVPQPVYWLYPLGLAAALLVEKGSLAQPKKLRWGLAGLFIFCCGAIWLMFFAARYKFDGSTQLGWHEGRYFVPFVPLLMIALSGLVSFREGISKYIKTIALVGVLAALGFYGFGLYAVYYTECGYGIYIQKECVLPIYRNLDKVNTPTVYVDSSQSITQSFEVKCDRLNKVQVFIQSVPGTGKGTLNVSLSGAENQVIAAASYPAREVSRMAYLDLSVPQQERSAGSLFVLHLDSSDAQPGSGFGVAASPVDYYPGKLSVLDAPRARDVIIHYVCANPFAPPGP